MKNRINRNTKKQSSRGNSVFFILIGQMTKRVRHLFHRVKRTMITGEDDYGLGKDFENGSDS